MINHSKNFGIYHWDTFDNETFLIDEADTLEQAITKVEEKYGDRISSSGADQVDVVNQDGDIVRKFSVG